MTLEYGGRADPGHVEVMGRVYGALREMGFGETETKRALGAVRSRLGPSASAEDVVRAALRVLTEGVGASS